MACENTNVLKAHKAHTKDSQIIRKDINTSCNVLLQNKNVLDLKLSPCSVCICFLFGNYPKKHTKCSFYLGLYSPQPGRNADPSLPSSAEVKNRVDLYLYSPKVLRVV